MSLSQQGQAVSIPYIAFPNAYGSAECVYINENGHVKKKSLSTVFLNSISFYSFSIPVALGTTFDSTTNLTPTTSVSNFSTPVYLCSPYANTTTINGQLQVGNIYWNFTTLSFYGYLCVLININGENAPAVNTYVNCLVSGALSTATGAATVLYTNPIIMTTTMQVLDPQADPVLVGSAYFPGNYTDAGVANAIRARLRGTVQISFPTRPVYTWLNYASNPNDQYFSAAYSPF